jgi:hypothetical protein
VARRQRKPRNSGRRGISGQVRTGRAAVECEALPSQFRGIPIGEAIQQARSAGEELGRQFEGLFQELRERILSFDPVSMLCVFLVYGLSAPEGSDRELTDARPILQSDVELLQALCLQHPHQAFGPRPFTSADLSSLADLVQDSATAFQWRRLARLEPSMSLGQRQQLRALERMRGDTQVIRNWGYPDQITSAVTRLFAPLDDDIEEATGVRIADLVAMCLTVKGIAEDRLNRHLGSLLPVFRADTIGSVVGAYYRSFPDLESTPEELLLLMKQRGASLEEVQAMLLSHSDLRLPDICTFSLNDFIGAYPQTCSSDDLERILEGWALSFGDLADRNPEHFFLANPVWPRPLIRLGDRLYCMPILGIFYSFCLELMESVVQQDAALRARYEDRRGNFLEDEVEAQLKLAFPSASIHRGSQWHDPVTDKDFENDLLLVIDSHLMVIEAKSGRVPPPARRGAEARLQRTIDDLLVAPSVQSKRFADYLRQNPGPHVFSTRRGITNEVDTSMVHKVIRLTVTFEQLADLTSHWPDLRAAGFIPEDMEAAPTMSLADLEIIFHILEGSCERLHYLVRRAEFEEHADYLGDEMDLLALYIETGFNVGEAEFDGTGLYLWGMSKALDPYFMLASSRQGVSKPHLRLTEWWRDLLQRIEERQAPRWTELGQILLSVAYDDQAAFEKGFKRVRRIVCRQWQVPGHDNVVLLRTGPAQRREAIVGLAYKGISREQRNQLIENAAGDAIESVQTDRVLVIGVDVARGDYPYSVIAVLDKR